MKSIWTMVMQGLKCPPDVAEQILTARTIPAAYANPICSRAARSVRTSLRGRKNRLTRQARLFCEIADDEDRLRTDAGVNAD